MRKRRSSGRVTLQDVANYVGVGTMTVSRVMRQPELVSEKVRHQVEQAARLLGYQPNQEASELATRQQPVTLKEVAQHAEVGVMTVSRALRDPQSVSAEALQKVNAAVAALGYVVDSQAATLATFQNSVAVLYPDIEDRPSAALLASLQRYLDQQQFQLLQACHHYNQFNEAKVVEKLLQHRPAALILIGAQLSQQTRALLAASEVLIINVASADAMSADLNLQPDTARATEEMTLHLLAKNYGKIAFIGAHTDNRLHRQQLNGWNKAMLAHYHNNDMKITQPEAPSLQFGRNALGELLQTYPDLQAVICSHELLAIGVLFECQRRLIKVPYDLAVVSLEGTDNSAHTFPALTAMHLDYDRLGRQIAETIAFRQQPGTQPDTEPCHLHFDLIVRASS